MNPPALGLGRTAACTVRLAAVGLVVLAAVKRSSVYFHGQLCRCASSLQLHDRVVGPMVEDWLWATSDIARRARLENPMLYISYEHSQGGGKQCTHLLCALDTH